MWPRICQGGDYGLKTITNSCQFRNLQITKSVVQHQFNRYVEEKLEELGQGLSDEELEVKKKEIEENAQDDLYPGKPTFDSYELTDHFITHTALVLLS